MSLHHPWSVLGIEPTEDRRAIRIAYTHRLKEIDVEADPQAFIALREAFESAQHEAEWAEQEHEDDAPEDDGDAVDAADIAAELDWQKCTVNYLALPPAPDRSKIPADPRWERTEAPEAHREEKQAVADDDRWETPAPDDEPAPELPPLAHRPNPWGPAEPEDVDARVQALLALLHAVQASGGASPRGWEAEMLDHWRVIAADPRMQEIGHYADAERWWGDVLAQSIPWSDPLLRPAAELFGWLAQADEISQGYAAAAVVRRLHGLHFLRAVQERKHPLNAAWRELVRPARSGSWRGWVNSIRVRELLATVREHFPDLESHFDENRVGIWEGRVTSPGGGYSWTGKGPPWWGWGLILFFCMAMWIGLTDKPPKGPGITPVPPIMVTAEPLSAPIPDIDRLLEAKFGSELDVATIRTRNPALHKKLLALWNEHLRAGSNTTRFRTAAEALLDRWYRVGIRNADVELLTDYHRLSIDMAKALHGKGAGKCAKFMKGHRLWDDALGLDPAFREREHKLMVRTLLGTDGVWRDYPGATVPQQVIARAAQRAQISEEAVTRWIEGKSSASDDCDTTIAVYEVVLEQPAKVRLPILRVL